MQVIKNRLEKNYKKLKAWTEKLNIEAFRLYDRDIPEYPYIIDLYKDNVVIYDKTNFRDQNKADHYDHVLEAVKSLLNPSANKIFIKKRKVQSAEDQYQKIAEQGHRFAVQEGPAQFYVNLTDYLDTGLFLDHRIMRHKIYKEAAGKNILNLFSYTCSVSVFGALGGAKTTSVDLSQTYLDWGRENFKLNKINFNEHQFIRENVLEFLKSHKPKNLYDIIFLDPPTFSNSKKMDGIFDVQRDHIFLVKQCMQLLSPQGILYFSNNKRDFKMDLSLKETYKVKDISKETIPYDFHDQKIHCTFSLTSGL